MAEKIKGEVMNQQDRERAKQDGAADDVRTAMAAGAANCMGSTAQMQQCGKNAAKDALRLSLGAQTSLPHLHEPRH